jgi:hypothetical protein
LGGAAGQMKRGSEGEMKGSMGGEGGREESDERRARA